jgi:hypothetical protein
VPKLGLGGESKQAVPIDLGEGAIRDVAVFCAVRFPDRGGESEERLEGIACMSSRML